MEQDIDKLIEELTKVRPDELSTDGLKLFNKINEIIDKNKELEEENTELKKCLEVTSKALDNVAYDQIPIAIADLMIPKALVEEKIEERKLWLSSNDIGYKDDYVLEVLQELLERWK